MTKWIDESRSFEQWVVRICCVALLVKCGVMDII